MSRKKNELLRKITELESVFGQKETARRLGISPSTLRNYKTGKRKTPLPKNQTEKINRVYGQNKKHVTADKVQKYQSKVQKKRNVRKEFLLNNPKTISTKEWVRSEYDEHYIISNVIEQAPPFVATIGKSAVQFMDAAEIFNGQYGLPAGTKSVTVYGLYATQFKSGGVWVNLDNRDDDEIDEDKLDFVASPTLIMLRQEMNLSDALDYLESNFYKTGETTGRRRLSPSKFIGYQL